MSSSLFCLKTGRHCSLGLRSTKYSVLKKPVVSVPSSGRPVWLTTLVTSGKAESLSRASFMMRRLSVGPVRGRERAADPDGAFVEVREELGADDAAEAEEDGEEQRQSRKTDR